MVVKELLQQQQQQMPQILEHQTRMFEAILQNSNDVITNTTGQSLYNPEEGVMFFCLKVQRNFQKKLLGLADTLTFM